MHLFKLEPALFPIKLFRKYVEVAKIKESQKNIIFRQIWGSEQGFKLKDLDKPISYIRFRRLY